MYSSIAHVFLEIIMQQVKLFIDKGTERRLECDKHISALILTSFEVKSHLLKVCRYSNHIISRTLFPL